MSIERSSSLPLQFVSVIFLRSSYSISQHSHSVVTLPFRHVFFTQFPTLLKLFSELAVDQLLQLTQCINTHRHIDRFGALQSIRSRNIGIRIVPTSNCNDDIDNLYSSVKNITPTPHESYSQQATRPRANSILRREGSFRQPGSREPAARS